MAHRPINRYHLLLRLLLNFRCEVGCHNTIEILEESGLMTTCDEVKRLLGEVLQIGDRIDQFDRSTPLLGNLPEFDSMAVISLITALEEHFKIVVEDTEISAETFETMGDLCDFVDAKVEQ